MSDTLSQLRRLIRRANLRVRLQRAFDAACGGLLPALVLAAMAILLAKHGLLSSAELGTTLALLGALVGLLSAAAALWPIDPLGTLVELDANNGLSDRLSSAWAFAQLPPSERTPEMILHLERAARSLASVRPSKAPRFRPPPELVPAVLMLAVVAFVAVLDEPHWAPLPEGAAALPVAPRYILDLAALRPEIRQIERLTELAEESEDPAVQALADELQSLLERAERGVLTEDELLDALARIEEALATLETEPPADMTSEWTDVAETLREVLADAALPEGLADEVEAFLEALEQGDEAAVADALDTLRELLESEDLDPEDLAALADALSALAEAFDPSDFDLRQELDALRDQIAELEDQLAGGQGGRRTERDLERAREALANAEERLGQSQEGLGEAGETRRDLADSLRDAAEALREPPGEAAQAEAEPGESELAEGEPAAQDGPTGPESSAEHEASEGEERVDQRGTETAERSEHEAPPEGGAQGEGQPSEAERDARAEGRQPGQEQAEGEPREPGSEAPSGEPGSERAPEASGEPPGQPREGQPGDAGATRPSGQPQTPQERAADDLERAADQLRERQRQEARAEARERGEQATEGMRENLQRNNAEPREGEPEETLAEQNWDEFLERAEGQGGRPEDEPQDGPQGESQSGGEPAEQASGEAPSESESGVGSGDPTGGDRGEPNSEGEGQEGEGHGDVAGPDALGEEPTALDSRRERVEAEVEVTEDGEAGRPTTGEVLESAAVEGFASRDYQEVYQQYAEAVEDALRSQDIPPGYARFIERYFGLIEPRR